MSTIRYMRQLGVYEWNLIKILFVFNVTIILINQIYELEIFIDEMINSKY